MSDSAFPAYAYRPDLDLFTVRWPTHELPATSRSDYDALLLLPEARLSPRGLFDVRRRPSTNAATAHWVVTDWLPRAAALHPAALRLAYLIAPIRAAELAADTALGAEIRPATLPGLPFLLRAFTDEGEAVRWLLG